MRRACRVWLVGGLALFGAMAAVAFVRAGVVSSGNGIPADVLARSAIARANMRQIASAMYSYANGYDGCFPPDLRMLYPDYISDPTAFWHPGDSDPPPTTIDNNDPDQPNSTRISYGFTPARRVDDLCEADPLIWDSSPANNAGWFVNKLTGAGYFKTDPPWITPTPTRRDVALANLRSLALAMCTYAGQGDGRYPADPAILAQTNVCSPSMFWNPGDSDPEPTEITNAIPNAPNSAQLSYAFLGQSADDEPLAVLLEDNSLANNEGLGAFVVTNDSVIAFFEPCTRSLPSAGIARDNLRQIGQALQAYAAANGGQFPARLSMLYPAYIADPAVFWNPGDRDPCPTAIDNDVPNGRNSAQVSYNYPAAACASPCGAGVILVADNSLANNGGSGINMLTADGAAGYYCAVVPFRGGLHSAVGEESVCDRLTSAHLG